MDYATLKANAAQKTRQNHGRAKRKSGDSATPASSSSPQNAKLLGFKLFSYLICHGEECRLPIHGVAKRLRKFSGDQGYDNKKALAFVNSNRDRFLVKTVEGKEYVEARTSIKLCDLYQEGKCRKPSCNGLHICRFFLEDSCKFGDECKKPHGFDSPETKALLSSQKLECLSSDGLKTLFQKVLNEKKIRHASSTAGPSTCKFYNKSDSCKNGDKCPFLHVCEHFVAGDCSYGAQRCKRQHSFDTTHARKVLAAHNLGDIGNEGQIVSALRGQNARIEDSCSSDEDDSFMSFLSSLAFRGKPKSKPTTSPHLLPRSLLTPGLPTKVICNVEKLEICGFNLRGKCSYGDKCNALHTGLPYQWQYCLGENWCAVADDVNRKLEEEYCDHEVENVSQVNLAGLGVFTVDFLKMVAQRNDLLALPLRRLSTVSSVLAASGHVFRTTWKWYWLDEHDQWHCYDDGNADVTSEEIELQFQSESGGERFQKFSAGSRKYTLHFDDVKNLYQQNDVFKTKRAVRRRPAKYLNEKIMKQVLEDFKRDRRRTGSTGSTSVASYSLPSTWAPLNPADEFKLVDLSKVLHYDEYSKVKSLFVGTMSGYTITSVKRVQNPGLWEEYERYGGLLYKQKSKIAKKNSDQSPEERWLFHGTAPDIVEPICQQGFDWRLSGTKHGARYGKGSYFAAEASYSHNYSARTAPTGRMRVFMAKVIVGSYVVGSYETQRPPAKNAADPLSPLHDSCVNSVTQPTIFVIFERSQAYPYYIIDYTN